MLNLSDEQIEEIAAELRCGMVCYIHKKTGELIYFPDPERFYDGDFEPWEGAIEKVENKRMEYLAIQDRKSCEAYQVMEKFAETIEDPVDKGRFFERLRMRKPFANFNDLVHNSPYREAWFEFNKASYHNYVKKKLEELES